MLLPNDRRQMRAFFKQAWNKKKQGQPLSSLEHIITSVLAMHPEYQPLMEGDDEALERDYTPEAGQSNPFLHMGMHIALHEQLQANRPAGLREIYQQLCNRLQDSHQAEHQMIECLGSVLWEAQRNNKLPDEDQYLRCLKRLLK